MSLDADLAALLRAALDKALDERGHANLLVAGKTGVGKSTLVNAVFQGDFATTGQGRPVTPTTREITKEGVPLTVFDSRGLEVAAYEETFAELEALILERKRDPDPNRHIHVAWLCVAEDSRRVEEAESELARMLARHVPVVAVVTKARADQGFRAEVQRLLPEARNVVRVRALAERFDDGHELPTMGLESLIDVTEGAVPEGVRGAVVAVQKVDLAKKRTRSHRIVTAAALSALGVGASPVPFSDALALAPIQVGMLAGISATFGLPLDRVFLGTLVSGAMTTSGGTVAGRATVAGLLKLVPGAGTVVGGVIAGGTAALLTTAFGEAYVEALSELFRRKAAGQISAEEVAEAFTRELQRKGAPARTGADA